MANVGVHSYYISTKRASVFRDSVRTVFFLTCKDDIATLATLVFHGSVPCLFLRLLENQLHAKVTSFGAVWVILLNMHVKKMRPPTDNINDLSGKPNTRDGSKSIKTRQVRVTSRSRNKRYFLYRVIS